MELRARIFLWLLFSALVPLGGAMVIVRTIHIRLLEEAAGLEMRDAVRHAADEVDQLKRPGSGA